MPFCSNCGRDAPPGAVYCPDCGSAFDLVPAQPPGQPTQPYTFTAAPAVGNAGDSAYVSPSYPEQRGRFSSGKKVLALVVVFALVVLLVGVALNSAIITSAPGGGRPVNSATTPVNGSQLYDAYSNNLSQADASYTNKTVYIQDTLDFGVFQDPATGEYFSSVSSGDVVLIWSGPSQTAQLSQGVQVLAECFVDGFQLSQGSVYLVYLQDCNVVSVQAPTTTTTATFVPPVNL